MAIMEEIARRIGYLEKWVREHAAFEPTNSTCLVYQTGGVFPIPDAANTTITFDTDEYDPDDLHSTTSNTDRITIVVPGVYVLTANGNFTKAAGTWRIIYITVNAAIVSSQSVTGSGNVFNERLSCSTQKLLAAGDIVRMDAYQNSGGQLNINDPRLGVTRIS